MTDIHIFQLLGLVFFAIGIGMLTNPKFIKNILQELERSTADMLYGGLISVTIGYFLVAFHNVWSMNRSLIITLLGWLALIKGLSLLMFPTYILRLYKVVDKYKSYISYFVIALGIVSLYFGYFS